MTDQTKIGYMCKVDFIHELEEAPGGISIYKSIEDIKKERTCVDECGIVKVEIKITEVTEKGEY